MPVEPLSGKVLCPSNWIDLVRYRALYQADDTGFTFLTDGETDEVHLTYAQLDRDARRIAGWLQSRGFQGQRALLLYPPGLEFITAFFGCLYAGVIAVPVYPPRRNRSIKRILSVIGSARPAVALSTDGVLQRIEGLLDENPALKTLVWNSTESIPGEMMDTWKQPAIDSDTTAFLQFTSGSTGTPKGVVLTHGNMMHNSMLICHAFEHTRSSSGVFWLPSYHDMGLIGGILQPIYCSRPNVLMSPMAFLQRPFRWLSAITRYRASTSGGPNFAYDLCVRKITPEQRQSLDLSSWRVAFNGAEPIRRETLDRFIEAFEPCGFDPSAFYPCFGLAEATLMVTGGRVTAPPVIRTVDAAALQDGRVEEPTPESKVCDLVGSGEAIVDQKVVVADPETKQVCAPGTVGEIWIQGPSVAKGYWDASESTEATFHAYLEDTTDGPYLRTGDLGFIDHGELFVTGRIKDLIIFRGMNIYPQDIERTVESVDARLRPNAGGAFVVEEGEDQRLVVVQELERRVKNSFDELIARIRRAVSVEHELALDAIVLVRAGSVPKTSSGKIQRHLCRTQFLEGSLKIVAEWSAGQPLPEVPPTAAVSVEKNTPVRVTHDWPTGQSRHPSSVVASTIARTGANGNGRSEENESSQAGDVAEIHSEADTIRIVLDEVRAVAGERADGLTLDTDITTIGLDSLERMEIVAALEDRFGGRLPEEILPDLLTCRQVVDAVRQHLGGPTHRRTDRPSNYEVPDEAYRIDQFPEYKRLRSGLDLLEATDLNHYFDVHEGITNDRTVIDGREFINFSSYNYVAMSGDPVVIEAAQHACERYGTSVSASRLVSGEKDLHGDLERAISEFLGTEDTIVFVGGHATNETVIGHMLGPKDLILHDALAHNSIVQGAILSGARRRPFPHNDWEAADRFLERFRHEYRRVMLVVEGVYSMDGDYPDLPRFVELRNRHRALLMIDEAHSIGVLGKTGRGIAEHFDVARDQVDVWMSTLSKTFGSCGGYISGNKALVEYLKYTAPGFLYSVGISPPNAAAALASLRLLEAQPERVQRLRENSKLFLKLAKQRGLNTGHSKDSAVIPVILGNSMHSLRLSKALFDRGVNVQPILHPAVEEEKARLRFFLTSSHRPEQIRYTVDCVTEELEKIDASYLVGDAKR